MKLNCTFVRQFALLLLLSTMSYQPSAFAQGTAFTYQGQLNNNGTPDNGSYDVSFALFGVSSGGSAIAGPVTNSVSVSNGLFTTVVNLGNVFNSSTNWLQIAVSTNGANAFFPLSPRQQLTPTPYAIYAESANATNLVGTVPTGNLSGVALLNGGNNTFVGQQTVIASASGVAAGGSIDPSIFVHVYNSATDGNTSSPDFAGIGFGHNSTQQAIVGGTFGNDYLDFYTGGLLTFPKMRIDFNGNVGIGTTTPKHTLDVNGNLFFGKQANGQVFTELGDTLYLGSPRKYLGNTLGAQVNGSTDWINLMAHPFSQGIMFGLSGPSDTDPHSAPVPLMVIKSSGNVGIGTTTPSGPLSVATSAGTLSVVPDTAVELVMKGGVADGALRVRNRIEMWAKTNLTSAGYLDVRDTNNNPVISLDGGNGNVTCVAINITSDRNAKEDFTPVNARAVLDKVAHMPITEWQYKKQGDARHIGPMAQDFRDAFTLGQDEKHISVVDEGGVALAAIQGLNQKLDEKDARIKELESSVAALKQLVDKIAVQQSVKGAQ